MVLLVAQRLQALLVLEELVFVAAGAGVSLLRQSRMMKAWALDWVVLLMLFQVEIAPKQLHQYFVNQEHTE